MFITGFREEITELLIQDPIKQESVQSRSEKNTPMPLLQMTGSLNLNLTDPMEIIHLLQTLVADQAQDLKLQNPTDLQQGRREQLHPNQNQTLIQDLHLRGIKGQA